MRLLAAGVVVLIMTFPALAGENLRLNAKLDYTSDSQDGALIAGDHMEDGFTPGKPAYVIFYGEGCYNSKRQARRTVSLYEKYKGQVQFVIVDLDHSLSAAEQEVLQGLHSACCRPRQSRASALQQLGRSGRRHNIRSAR